MKRESLIIDKNVLHGAGGALHSQLRERYHVVQARCLFHELLKNVGDGKEHEAGQNARKLQAEIDVHAPWTSLVERALDGVAVPMDGTPIVDGGVGAYDGAGNEVTLWVHTDDGPVSIYEYKARQIARGELDPAEVRAKRPPATAWDRQTVAGRLASHLPSQEGFRLKGASSEEAVVDATDKLLTTASRQRDIMNWLIDSLHLPAQPQARLRRRAIKERWRQMGRPLLRDFAPYAHFCARVALLYAIGWSVWPKGREAKDRADLEYLMHLPFCTQFATDDKMVRAMAAHLLRADQALVSTVELKSNAEALPSSGATSAL